MSKPRPIERFGLSHVYLPLYGEPTVDIVLIHGLNGHPHDSWTSQSGRFWPSDLLPPLLKSAQPRILTYGYTATVSTFTDSASREALSSQADALISNLLANRRLRDCSERPLIFVCHSLGGLLVKSALLRSKSLLRNKRNANVEAWESFYTSTFGILFFGTPHNGHDTAKWSSLLQNICGAVLPKEYIRYFTGSSKSTKELRTNNETLQKINGLFMDIIHQLHIFNFYESIPMEFNGTQAIVVDQISAAPYLNGLENWEIMRIEENHINLCKLDDEDSPGYDIIMDALLRCCRQAPAIIAERWRHEKKVRAYEKKAKARELFNSSSDVNSLTLPPKTAEETFYNLLSPGMNDVKDSLSPSVLEKSQALFVVPPDLQPNAAFFGMKNELEVLHNHLVEDKENVDNVKVVLVSGPPGSGKSHLARQYVFTQRKYYPGGIIWIDATSRDSMNQCFWEFAVAIGGTDITDTNEPEITDHYMLSVRKWLETHQEWLLVLDGLRSYSDDIDAFGTYLPQTMKCSILYTAVDSDLQKKGRLFDPYCLSMPRLQEADACKLLYRVIGIRRPSQEQNLRAIQIVQTYECLPLSIYFVGRRIRESASSIENYGIKPTNRKLAEPFFDILGDLRRLGQYQALSLIDLLSFLDHRISVGLLNFGRHAFSSESFNILTVDQPGEEPNIHNTLSKLVHYGLIELTVTGKPSYGQNSMTYPLVSNHKTSYTMINTVRLHRPEQAFCIDELRIGGENRKDNLNEKDHGLYHSWLIIATRFLQHSYWTAQKVMMGNAHNCGLVSDYMEYQRHASRLASLFPKVDYPILHEARDDLAQLRRSLSNTLIQISSGPSMEVANDRLSVFSSKYFQLSEEDLHGQLSGQNLHGKEVLQSLVALDGRRYKHNMSVGSGHDSRTEVISDIDDTQDDEASNSPMDNERSDHRFVLTEASRSNLPVELPTFQLADTITNTSQYVSDMVFSAENHSALQTGTSLPSEIDEIQTVYSDTFTLKGSLKEIYVDELVRKIIKDISGPQLNSLTARRIADVMPGCLKAFSLRLGSIKSSQQEQRDVTAFIRKYRQEITDALMRMTLDDSSPAPASDDAPTSWETRVGSGMPLHDIMEQWSKYEVEGMDNGTWIEPDESLDGRDEYSSGDVEGFNMGPAEEIDADEALSTTMPALEKYREFIVENPAYDWFLNDIRKHCHLAPSIPDVSAEIRKTILQALPSQTSFSRREPIDLYKMTYSMDWDLVSFLNEQQYNEEAHRALPLVITLTGSREAAQAFTCSQYLHQTWPSSAGELLKLLQSVLQKGKAAGDLPDGTKLAAWLHSSDTSMEQNLQIETIGSAYSVTEVGELLSWLGSALRTSPYLDQIAYCRPRVSRFQTIVHNHENSKHQYAAEITAEISCTIEKKKAPSGINGDCWHGLFRNCVVVEGYPIPRRTEDDAANGLEIPLGMMASLAQAKYVNTFLGTPILKGFSSMLVPTGVHDNAISWHLVHNKNGDRISYLDSTVTPAKGLVAGRLSQTRHILGWCSDARYLAGTKDAKCDVAGSRLPKPRDNGIYSQTFITSGQLITGGSPFLVGYKDTPFHVSRAGYIRKLKWIIQKSVVLWDEETKRGWLLNGASALLHLVRASIVHDSTGPLSSECLFQWDQLEEGPSGSAHIPGSAIALLLNRNNRALAIYGSKDEDIKFEDRVEHFLSILEQIFDYEVYAVGPDGDGYTSKSIPRAHFEGWDFHDLATESDPLYPRLAKIASKGKAWIDFTRSIHAINLLGRGFGDILEPLNSSCSHWASLPKDQYYLAAGIADLQKIVEYTGDLKANPIRLSEDLVWHNPERVFDFCGCVDATTNHADVVQVILPAALSESENQYNSSIDLYHTGAVVFGYSRDFQWRWGDSGDPERDDIHTDEQDHLSPNYDLAPDNSNTSSIGSKSDLAPLSSIEAPSTEDTNLTSCAEEECTQPKPLARSYTHWNLASLRAEDYAVGIVCALSLELLAVRALFDQTHPTIELSAADSNHYALGSMGRHRVVAACLPDGEYGTNSAADVASNLRRSFPSVKFCLLVGIGGGVPSPTNDIRLGDVVVSKPIGMNPGVIQYDMGKAVRNGVFEQNGVLHAPPRMIMTALSNLKSDPHLSENPLQEYIDEIAACRKEYRYPGPNKDRLFSSRFVHNSKHATCDTCSDAHVVLRHTRSGQHPRIHYGLIASGNSVIKDAALRDKWRKESNVLCFEMEAAGIMNTLPCLVIRGICDYSDSHKNKAFQEYAAATAASYAKLLLSYIKDTNEMDGMALRSIKDDQSLLGAFRRALAFLPMRGA